MKLAVAQMHMEEDIGNNLKTSLDMMEKAKDEGAELIFFPEIQLSPFFPKYQGAELVLIPTANLTSEPMELFEWEIRVQAYQNTVFAAMCNRVGREDDLTFAGQSLTAGPDGSLLFKAGSDEGLFCADIALEEVYPERKKRGWLVFD